MLRTAYRATNNVLERFGFSLVRPDRSVSLFSQALHRLRRLGFDPSAVFDIGVAQGTPELYRAFPKAKYFLIDPLPQSVPFMQEWAKSLNAEIKSCALGETDGTVEIDVRPEIACSSILPPGSPIEVLQRVEVPLRRFDTLFAASDMPAPTLVKIDVQGAELMVLRGMGNLIHRAEIVICEVQSMPLSANAPHMLEVIDFMRSRSFAIYDICGIHRRPFDGAMAQLDVVFCKSDSQLLKENRRWS
jgi:FkbM family methyltransferase